MTSCLRDFDLPGLVELVDSFGAGPGRARTLFRAIHAGDVVRPLDLQGVNRDLRRALDDNGYTVSPLTLRQICLSRCDPGTAKFLFSTTDGLPVESVLMPATGNRTTLCVSSQVGCRMGCVFCQTGRMGLIRQLSRGEIVSQLVKVQSFLSNHGQPQISNIVFMGMGEPFDNFAAVMGAFDTFNHNLAFGLSRDRITISTAGHVDGLAALAKREIRTNVAISLNATNDQLRSRLMPINRRWPLGELVAALRRYPLRPGRVFVIEYVLFAGVNDSPEDASALGELLQDLPFKTNIIQYNGVSGTPFESPSADRLTAFAEAVSPYGKGVLIRRSRGGDIAAACGQLGLRRPLRNA